MTVPHITQKKVPRQRRRRTLVMVATGALAVGTLGVVSTGTAYAESRTATAGSLQWGIKASTFAYHMSHTGASHEVGGVLSSCSPSQTNTSASDYCTNAPGSIPPLLTPADGAIAAGSPGAGSNPDVDADPQNTWSQYGAVVPAFYNWPFVSGTYDTTSNALTMQYGGSVTMSAPAGETCGPGCGASPFKYFKYANPKVVLDFTANTKQIFLDLTPTLGGTATTVQVANLTIASAATAVSDVVTYSGRPAKVAAPYVAALGTGASIAENDPMDKASFSATAPAGVVTTPTPTPTPPAGTPTPTPPAGTPTPTPVGSVPASGNPVYALTGSSFTWGLADTFQFKGAGPCHTLSAGYVPNGSTTFNATSGNVSIVDGSGSALTAGACTTPGSNVPISQNVKFSGGSGFIDPVTKAAVVNFTGSASMLMNGGATPIRITNPSLKVNADGTGVLTGMLTSTNQTGATYQGNNKTIAKFTGMTLGTTGFTHTPDYLTKTIDLGSGVLPAAANQFGDWGAWPQDFVSFANLNGNAAFFYSTGNPATAPPNSQTRKKTNPLTAVYGTQGTTALSGAAQTLQVTVLNTGVGEFSWRILQNATVNLGDPVPYAGDKTQYSGALNQVEVTDNRNAGTWSLSGQSGNFALVPATTPATTFGGFFLGWTPSIVTGGANALAGAPVDPGTAATQGLSSSRPLATGGWNGSPTTGVLGAGLVLRIPSATTVGDYRATLTLTALAI